MKKVLNIALSSALLLTGCSLKTANASVRKPLKPEVVSKISMKLSKVSPEIKESPLFKPQATISVSPITYESSNTRISIIDRLQDVSKVTYTIWRTADGSDSIQSFSSVDKENDFPFLLNVNDFSGKRGEYQIEVYGTLLDGTEELLAKSAVTFQQRVPILMYHAIDEFRGDGFKELFVTPENFETQMSYLKENGFTLLTFERWEDVNKVNKPVLVTFDDGMKNNMNAFHILQKMKNEKFLPTATEYVIAGYIDSGSYRLSTQDIREMSDSGIFSIQSHTMSHADLPTITNYEEEFDTSRKKIEQITGKPVIAIAYPYGHFNDEVVKETKKYYKFATTTKPGQFIEKGEPDELFLIHRVRISYSTTIKQFAALVETY